MNNLTVSKAMILKGQTEVAICDLIRKFTDSTGLTVHRVDIDNVGVTEARENTVDVHLVSTLELPR
jgi:hypothetical protein